MTPDEAARLAQLERLRSELVQARADVEFLKDAMERTLSLLDDVEQPAAAYTLRNALKQMDPV